MPLPSRRLRSACFLSAVLLSPLAAQVPLFVSAQAGAGLPLGVDASLFKTGAAGAIGGGLELLSSPRLALGPSLSYSYLPLRKGGSVSVADAGLRAELGLGLGKSILAGVYGGAGFYFAVMEGESGGNPSVEGGGFLGLRLGPALMARIGGGYRGYIGLCSGIGLTGGVVLSLRGARGEAPRPEKPQPLVAPAPASGAAGLAISAVELDSVFPVFFKHYDDHPFGSVLIKNGGAAPAKGCRVEFLVKQYMDNPKLCAPPFDVAPGEEREVQVLALFTDRILDVTEGTKLSATVSVAYDQGGAGRSVQAVETLVVLDRNAIVWDDDRRIAAFVTAKDPQVMRFARLFAALAGESSRYGLPAGLLAGAAMHEALAAYGIKYIKDPAAGYAGQAKDAAAVDFMQFPSQTLSYKGGDCDDLTVLYCALLHSIGYEAAFITVQGHIYAAVDLGMEPAEARKRFSRPDELILEGGRSWLPIEVTMVAPGFLAAWQEGAREWREAGSKGLARIYPVTEAWKTFGAVGFSGAREELALPGEEAVRKVAEAEVVRFVDREIFAQVAQLQAEIKKAQGDPRALNKLGVLYARYGLYDRAKEQFSLASARQDFAPALVNLGNLASLAKDPKAAIAYFQRAYDKDPANPSVILALAKANHDSENYGSSRELYEKLKAADPVLAARYSYLDLRGQEATRAAEAAGLAGAVPWSE